MPSTQEGGARILGFDLMDFRVAVRGDDQLAPAAHTEETSVYFRDLRVGGDSM